MKHETYKGRKLKTVKGKVYGYVRAYVNGVDLGLYQGNEEYALQSMRSTLDYVDTDECEFGRYGAEWYAPGTCAVCEECTASMAVDGPCLSDWCMKKLHKEALAMNEEIDAQSTPACVCPPSYAANDYHEIECPEAPRQTPEMHHYNALGGQRFIEGRGWVSHCRVCHAPEGEGNHFYNPGALNKALEATAPSNEENDVKITEGPLTERQWAVLRGVSSGKRYDKIARQQDISLSVVKHEVGNIVAKFGTETLSQAVARSATANAYRQAADLMKEARIPNPSSPSEEHVNHVLEGLETFLRIRATRLLPQ